MPTGIFKRTLEHNRHIAESQMGEKNHRFGKKATDEERRRKSEAHKGLHHSEETIEKIRLSNLGKKRSVETREKIRIYHLGRKLSLEHRQNIGKKQIGKKHSVLAKRNMSLAQKGKKVSEETKNKIRLALLGRKNPNNSGHLHSGWKGGITPKNMLIRHSFEYKKWSESVFKQNNYIDQKTGIRGGKLVAHHIQNFAQYPELRFAIDNGITLSDKAHKDFHKKYGYTNNTLEQIQEFLKN